jgi:outer membrane lipoprotein SlyB
VVVAAAPSASACAPVRGGDAIGREANAHPGVEVTVRLGNGRVPAVVQPDAGEGFRPGDRIRMLNDGRFTRATR